MRAVACFLWVLALAACGGKVVVDTGASTGTGGTSGGLTCAKVCMDSAAVCPGTTADGCATGCASTDKLGSACPDAYQALLVCTDANAASLCNGSTLCQAEGAVFSTCLTQACTADPTLCTP